MDAQDLARLNASAARVSDELNAALQRMGHVYKQPSYRYFGKARGWQFGWTTERIYNPDEPEHEKYQSFVYKPTGKGARADKASRWVLRDVRIHSTRKAAKARALRLYHQHYG